MPLEEAEDEYNGRRNREGGCSRLKKVKVCVCVWVDLLPLLLPDRDSMFKGANNGNEECARIYCWTVLLSYPHVRGVRRSQPILLLPPSSSLLLLCLVKKNLLSIEIATPISAHFCFERKGKHLLKTRVTKEPRVWRAKSLPYWCSRAFSLWSFSSFTEDCSKILWGFKCFILFVNVCTVKSLEFSSWKQYSRL